MSDRFGASLIQVTPTRRLAHWILRRHEEQALAERATVWKTPQVVTWAGFVERCFDEERASGARAGRWLLDAAARLVWTRIVEADRSAASLLTPALTGRLAHEAWQRMHAHEIPFEAVASDGRPEARAFARWAGEFTAWLSRGEWSDESTACASIGRTGAGPVIETAGFDEMTPAQRSALTRLASAGYEVHAAPAPDRRGTVTRVDLRDTSAELDAAARWAAARLDSDPRTRLAIVVPDLRSERDSVRRTVERVLTPDVTLAGGPSPGTHGFEIAAARPLSGQPLVYGALDAISAVVRPLDLAGASRLLRSPFLSGSTAERAARARLDARLRRYETPDLGLGRLAQLAGARDCPDLANALQGALTRVGAWPRRAAPSRWSALWVDLLTDLGWPGESLDSHEHQARDRWTRLLAEFGGMDDCVGALTAAEAQALLGEQADAVLFEPQETRAQLLVIDPDTCAGMEFDGLWVCGLHAGRWPASASPDPFLPRDWQLRQGVPGASAELAAASARVQIDRLCRSADEVILSVPQFEGDAPLLASALVARFPVGEPPASWSAPTYARAAFDTRPALARMTDGHMPRVTGRGGVRGGARLVELQSACPFRAQAEFRLGARSLEDPELGIAATDRGELVHAVLARVWRRLRDRAALDALGPEARRAGVRDAIDEECGPAIAAARGVLRELLLLEAGWIEARVMELLAVDLGRPAFTVVDVEREFEFGLGGMSLALRVDRIDRLPDGTLAVIDYKTGQDLDAGAWLGERPRLPQLPLYAEALAPEQVSALAFGSIRSGSTGYGGLAAATGEFPGLPAPGEKGWPRDYASWDELRAAWRRRLSTLAEEYAAGDARLAPDPSTACTYCGLGSLCRIAQAGSGADEEVAGDG
jgi:ATP-dependent helicase/nuclease subunit B